MISTALLSRHHHSQAWSQYQKCCLAFIGLYFISQTSVMSNTWSTSSIQNWIVQEKGLVCKKPIKNVGYLVTKLDIANLACTICSCVIWQCCNINWLFALDISYQTISFHSIQSSTRPFTPISQEETCSLFGDALFYLIAV